MPVKFNPGHINKMAISDLTMPTFIEERKLVFGNITTVCKVCYIRTDNDTVRLIFILDGFTRRLRDAVSERFHAFVSTRWQPAGCTVRVYPGVAEHHRERSGWDIEIEDLMAFKADNTIATVYAFFEDVKDKV